MATANYATDLTTLVDFDTIYDKILSVSNAPDGSDFYTHVLSLRTTKLVPAYMLDVSIESAQTNLDLQNTSLYGNISVDSVSAEIESESFEAIVYQENIGDEDVI